MELQSVGLRIETELETSRKGGAGPTDSGMLWIEGVPVTVPPSDTSPYSLRAEDDGQGVYRDGVKVASVAGTARPRFYDLTTADGIPYHQIALLHLDSLASTVVQACNYWGNSDQCGFCGIGLSLAAGRTIAKKTPEMLAEVAVAAKELDGAVDATLTTGSSVAPDRGALYVARCGQAVKEAAGLPVEVQFEPPRDLSVIDQVHDMGVDALGIHVESFDPAVLARVAPGKFRTGIETYFRTWEHAVSLFGEGRVSTYVILGMGEDPGPDRRDVPARGGHRRVPVRRAAAAGVGLADGGRPGAVAGVHRADLPEGGAVPRRPRARRRHGRRGLRPVPGVFVAEPRAAVELALRQHWLRRRSAAADREAAHMNELARESSAQRPREAPPRRGGGER